MNLTNRNLFRTTANLMAWAWVASAVHPAPGAQAKLPHWERQAVPLPESIWSVEAVDANRDGRLDLILAGRETRNAVWYRNR